MSSRKVLATNHVNEIMVKWFETGDWGKAFMEVIPKRKGGKLKDEQGKDESGGEPREESEPTEEDHAGKSVQQNAEVGGLASTSNSNAVEGAASPSTALVNEETS